MNDRIKKSTEKRKENNRTQRVGQQRVNENGLIATCVEYIDATNVVIETKNGIKKKISWSLFNKGVFSERINKNELPLARLGEERVMNCGLKAKIIKYISERDIDVLFENGEIVPHKRYGNFRRGQIAPPSMNDATKKAKQKFLHEKRVMNNGMVAEIVEWINNRDIIVQFEDGERVETSHQSFKRGCVQNANIINHSTTSLLEFYFSLFLEDIGFKKAIYRKNEHEIEVDFAYFCKKTNQKIGIEIDGHPSHSKVVADNKKNKKMKKFGYDFILRVRDSSFKNSDINLSGCDVIYMDYINNGYNPYKAVEGVVNEIFTWINHKINTNFIPRKISEKEIRKKEVEFRKESSKIGEVVIAEYGLKTELTKYISCRRVFVKIDGYDDEVETSYRIFRSGKTPRPGYNPRTEEAKNKYLGTKKKMNCGLVAEIVAFHSAGDIEVMFETGEIVKGVRVDAFKKGQIEPSNYNRFIESVKQKMNGMSVYQEKLGQAATFHDYNGENSKKIDVMLEDGTILKNVSRYRFENGTLDHFCELTNKEAYKKKYTGQTRTLKDGSEMQIIDIYSSECAMVKNMSNNELQEMSIESFFNRKTWTGTALKPKVEIGEKNLLNDGEVWEIISMKDRSNITIRRLVDGKTKKGISYNTFKEGRGALDRTKKAPKIGDRYYNKNYDMYVKIFEINNDGSVDIIFDDGMVRKGVSFKKVREGTVGKRYLKTDYLGMEKIMNNGMKATIIEYNNAKDVSVEFENGYILKNVTTEAFLNGLLLPDKKEKANKNMVGSEKTNE